MIRNVAILAAIYIACWAIVIGIVWLAYPVVEGILR